MCANPQSNMLNALAMRASYNLPILKRFPLESQKTRGWILSTGKVSLISVRWRVARLPGTLVDTLSKSVTFYA